MSDNYVSPAKSLRLDDGRWEHTFSQSLLGTFQSCPEQARQILFKEVDTSGSTDSQALGTGVHAGIEYALWEQKTSDRMLYAADMIDCTYAELDDLEWTYTKLSRAKVYDLAAIMLHAWHRDVYGTFEPDKIEHKFRRLLYSGKHRDIYIAGTMDCVDTDGLLWDWKTGSRPYERWEKQRWATQPTAYTWAWWDECNDEALRLGYPDEIPIEMEVQDFRYAVMLYDGGVQLLDIWRDQSHVNWMKAICSQIAWMIEHGLNPWPMTDAGWHCSETWCPVFAEGKCKGAHMRDSWKAYEA